MNNLHKTIFRFTLLTLCIFLTVFMLTLQGCSTGAGQSYEEDTSNYYTGYVYAPSLPAPMKDGEKQAGLVILTDPHPPAGYSALAGTRITSQDNLSKTIAITDHNGKFTIDVEKFAGSDSLTRNVEGDGGLVIIASPPSSYGHFYPVRGVVYNGNTNSEVTGITLVTTSSKVEAGKPVQFYVRASLENGQTSYMRGQDVIWSVSSDPGRGTITEFGVFTGTKTGKCQVNAVYKQSNNLRSTQTIEILETTYTLAGRVADPEGKPVRNAIVSNPDTGSIDITNTAGEYSLPTVPGHTDTIIQVTFNGRNYFSRTFNFTQDNLNFDILISSEPLNAGSIEGTVKSAGEPLSQVTVNAGGSSVSTDSVGYYRISRLVEQDDCQVSFVKEGYVDTEKTVNITANQTTELDVVMISELSLNTGIISGQVVDDKGSAISGASVSLTNNLRFPGKGASTTDDKGYFLFEYVEPGDYRLQVSKKDYLPEYRDITVIKAVQTDLKIIMQKDQPVSDEPEVTLKKIEISPANLSLPKGSRGQFKATGLYSDNSKMDITTSVNWISSNTTIATISNSRGSEGLAIAKTPGIVSITAEFDTVKSLASSLIVTEAELSEIQINVKKNVIAKGESERFIALGIYTDDTTQDISSQVKWESTNPEIIPEYDPGTSHYYLFGSTTGTAQITAKTADFTSAPFEFRVTDAKLVSIQLTPHDPSTALGLDTQLNATGLYTDNTTRNLNKTVIWAVQDTSIVTVSEGLATAKKIGTTPITAMSGSITSNSIVFEVSEAVLTRIEVEPPLASVACGLSRQFTAIGFMSDGTKLENFTEQVVWETNNEAVARISNAEGSHGLAETLAQGTVNITARKGDVISPSSQLTVTQAVLQRIEIDTDPVGTTSLPKGLTVQFKATGIYSNQQTLDLTEQVAWYSLSPSLLTVSNLSGEKGLATASSTDIGTAYVRAGYQGFTSPTYGIQITNEILVRLEVSPAGPIYRAKGLTQQFVALGVYSNGDIRNFTSSSHWVTSNPNVVVNYNNGLIYCKDVGVSMIRATLVVGSNMMSSNWVEVNVTPAILQSIEVAPKNISIPSRTTRQFTATGKYTDNTTSDITNNVNWLVDNPDVARISNSSQSMGKLTAISEGTTDVRAEYWLDPNTRIVSQENVITVVPPNPTISVAGGEFHSIALNTDGAVWAWGLNSSGQLGDQTTTRRLTPVQVTGLTDAIKIAAGGYHSLAIKADGTVWAWGYTQLANNTTTYYPVQVPGLSDVIAIEGGRYHSLVVKLDGTVYAWGSNYYGQLGDGSTSNRNSPVRVSGLTDVIAVAGGERHSLALKSDGTVYAWGENIMGQLGDGTTSRRLTPVKTADLSNVVAITAGSYFSLALKSDGTVWAWGGNGYGLLGDGTTNSSSIPVQVSGVSNITAIKTGSYFSLALKSDGTVWGWGANFNGQLGDGTTSSRLTPVQTSGLAGIVSVAGGTNHSLAVMSNGAAWSWGANNYGQLGDETTTNRLIPVQVKGYNGNGYLFLHYLAELATISISSPVSTVGVQEKVQFLAEGTFVDNSKADVTGLLTWSSGNPDIATAGNTEGSKGLITGIAQGSTTITAQKGSVTQSIDITVEPKWLPFKIDGIIPNCVWGSSADNVFIGGGSSDNRHQIYQYNGVNWISLVSDNTLLTLRRMWGASDSGIYTLGWDGAPSWISSAVYYYDGNQLNTIFSGSWSKDTGTGRTYGYTLNSIWGTSSDNIYVVGGKGTIMHYNGSGWTRMPNPLNPDAEVKYTDMNSYADIWGTSANNIYALSYDGGRVHRYNGTSWNEMSNQPSFGSFDIYRYANCIWGTSSSNLYIGHSKGVISYDGTEWRLSLQGPNIRRIWGTSPSNIYAAGSDGLYHFNGSSWMKIIQREYVTTFLDVWGSSPDNIYTMDSSQYIFQFRR
jgi:alpha-tubulin suppressor-like RCC1 family protein/protocatechuate 3,4-dioxygenase beta subunit